MITLYQIPAAAGMPISGSPYCAKVELYLKLTGRAYETTNGNMMKSPTKTVPYVKWADGSLQGESGDIIARLEAEGPALNPDLPADAAARGRALEALAQDVLYFANLYMGFGDDAGWAATKEGIKRSLPFAVAAVLPAIIRSSQKKKLKANGFPDAGAFPKAVSAVQEIAHALGDQDYLLGDAPSVWDCSVWANLALMAWGRLPNPGREAVRGDAALMAYVRRVAGRAGFELPPLP